jgi:dipeptidyl aminopeptidase/acylaminoacyl peptidase
MILVVLAILSAGPVGCTPDAPPLENIRYSEFVPPAGQGPVVIVLSGRAGPGVYSFIPRELVRLGYYVVLFNGPDFPATDAKSGENLRHLIVLTQHSSHARPGKIAVIGASAGGGAALAHATSLSDLVSVVVDYYPATRSIPDKADVIRRWGVPTLVFAGDADNNGCCMIDTIRTMVAAAKDRGAPVELVVYSGADHDFIWGAHYKRDAAEDAWQRTLTALRQHVGP